MPARWRDVARTGREQSIVVLLRQLWMGLSAYRLFPGDPERPGFVAAVERIDRAAPEALAGGRVEVEIRPEGVHLPDGHALHDDVVDKLGRTCFERRAECLIVTSTPTVEDLLGLFAVLSTTPAEVEGAGGPQAALEAAGVRVFSLLPVGPDAVGEDVLEELPRSGPGLEEVLAGFAAEIEPTEEPAPTQVAEEGDERPLADLLDVVMEDPFARRLLGGMSNAELTRALVELGRERETDPVDLARDLAKAGVRSADLIDLTEALAAGYEEAGTIVAGLERMGFRLDDLPETGTESISDVVSRYLLATEREDAETLRAQLATSPEERRAEALHAAADYASLEEDLTHLDEVLRIWSDTIRQALRTDERMALDLLWEVGDRAASDGEERRRLVEEALGRVALDPAIADLLADAALETESGRGSLALLDRLGEAGVEALMERLAGEHDRARRARLVGILTGLAEDHPDPVVARLTDPRWYVIRNAVVIIGRTGRPDLCRLVAPMGESSERAVRAEVATTIAACGAEAVPILRRLAADRDEGVRLRAIEGLAENVAPEALAALAEIVRSRAPSASRRQALAALDRNRSAEATAALEELASGRSRPRLRGSLRRLARRLLEERS